VEITGITVVMLVEGEEPVFMRYIDWLSAYAQLGIVEMRRPASVEFLDDSGGHGPAVVGWRELERRSEDDRFVY
jgi:hypothetical protein